MGGTIKMKRGLDTLSNAMGLLFLAVALREVLLLLFKGHPSSAEVDGGSRSKAAIC